MSSGDDQPNRLAADIVPTIKPFAPPASPERLRPMNIRNLWSLTKCRPDGDSGRARCRGAAASGSLASRAIRKHGFRSHAPSSPCGREPPDGGVRRRDIVRPSPGSVELRRESRKGTPYPRVGASSPSLPAEIGDDDGRLPRGAARICRAAVEAEASGLARDPRRV